jgi:hypothetical protein
MECVVQKYGIMIMSGFAALWFVWGLSAVSPINALWLLVPFAISGAMIALAVRMPVVASAAQRKATGKVVGVASGIEFVAIFAANAALASTGHAGLVVCATLAIVGLHFMPLAYYLRVPRYYAAGAALAALAAGGVAIHDDATRLLVLGVGAAVLLWMTSLAVFSHSPRYDAVSV